MSIRHVHQEMPTWIPRATFTVIACALSVVAGLWLVNRLSDLLGWFIMSLFLSFAIEPLTNSLEKRGWKRGTATSLVMLVLFLIMILFIGSMVPLVVAQIRDLIRDTPTLIDQINKFLTQHFDITFSTEGVAGRISELSKTLGIESQEVATNVIGAGSKLLGGLFQTFTVAIFTFYLVVDGPSIRRKTMAIMPARQQKIFLETWEIAIEKMGGYLYVRLILAGLCSVISFIVLSVAKVPFALPLALWMGIVSQFIPVIGTYIAAFVPLVVALLESPWSALVVIVYVVIYQQIENYFISPKLTEKTMQLHPAIAIGAAIAGATLYGPIGAFLALPAAAILQVVAGTYIKRHEIIEDDGDLLGVKESNPKGGHI